MPPRVLLPLGAVLLGAASLGAGFGGRHAAIALVGVLLGVALFHAAFGFTGAFRALLAEGRSAGVRAQLLMLALLLVLFTPALAAGQVLGQPVRGFVFPVGLPLLAGAFLFGVGMQLGGGCGSGTLYTAGGGALRMWITLAAFIAGSTLAAWAEFWTGWPELAPVSLARVFGPWPMLAGALALLGTCWALAAARERARHGGLVPILGAGGLVRGPWPLAWGAIGLALLNFATLLLAGRPWAITAAFPLWGSRLVEALGWDDPAFWPYWEDPTRTEALLRPLLADRTTVMDLGLMLGAALAAGLSGRGGPFVLPGARPALASLLGGLLLGLGAAMAFGCNISAFVGGIASGSLHGWVWIAPALLGNAVGISLRPWFGLAGRTAGVN